MSLTDSELSIALARIDERIIAIVERESRSERANKEALTVASAELARRLDILNHAHSEAIRVQATYLPRDIYERDYIESDKRFKALENFNSTLRGQMFWPILAASAATAALTAATVKLIFP